MNLNTENGGHTAQEPGDVRPDYKSAALAAYDAGFDPLPIRPGTKKPAIKWKNRNKRPPRKNIRKHWEAHPDHEVGIVLTSDIIVYDADSSAGVAALYELEKSLDLIPNLVVGTKRGEHHYFRRAEGTRAKTHTPNKTDHPKRVDIKTGKGVVIIPPSTGKRYILNEIETIDDLIEIGQIEIDAFTRHNGCVPEADKPEPIKATVIVDTDDKLSEIHALLTHLDPDMGYSDWVLVLMAAFHAAGGSDKGLELVNDWSSTGNKYQGYDEVEAKWRSVDLDHADPVTVATLHRLVKLQVGEARYRDICMGLGPQWDTSSDTTVTPALDDLPNENSPDNTVAPTTVMTQNPLIQYSLLGDAAKLKAESFDHNIMFGQLVVQGQCTVVYAPPGTGKTLIHFSVAIQAIKNGTIKPEHLFYINADDNYSGVITKADIAEKHGFHMLVPGRKGFSENDLLPLLKRLGDEGHAPNAIIFLDTLKKFYNPMDKNKGRQFGLAVRKFNAQGGTLIMLAHTNKNRNSDKKPQYGGTSDSLDDTDCAYIMDVLSDESDTRTVEFTNIKNRGDVAKKVVYQYSTAEGLTYEQLMESVVKVDPHSLDKLRNDVALEASGDKLLIELVTAFIASGIITKTPLVKELAKLDGVSNGRARKLIETYTGSDPVQHRWNHTVGQHGKHTYSVLDIASPDPAPAPKRKKSKKKKKKRSKSE